MSGDIGQIIDGKYRLTRLLGSGGMGAVYEGENVRIHRRVAIKMLHSQVSSQAETVTRFEREAQAAGRIGSEHICEVLDLGVMPDGTRYMVMEYLEGETLGARIKRFGRLTPQQTVPLVAQVLDALEAAHAVGIIHRDLKPDNVWIMPSRGGTKDFVKILDFGVSKFSQSAGGDEMNTTRAGSVVGTPYYMSPEQARGMGSIDGRTDVYAIGVVLYQAVTGQVPYQAETFNELLFKIVLEVAPPPQTYVPDLDPEFAGIILRAMSREPGQRYPNCAEFKAALLAFSARRPGGASRAGAAPRGGLAAGGTAFLDASPMPHPAAQRPSADSAWPHATALGPATERSAGRGSTLRSRRPAGRDDRRRPRPDPARVDDAVDRSVGERVGDGRARPARQVEGGDGDRDLRGHRGDLRHRHRGDFPPDARLGAWPRTACVVGRGSRSAVVDIAGIVGDGERAHGHGGDERSPQAAPAGAERERRPRRAPNRLRAQLRRRRSPIARSPTRRPHPRPSRNPRCRRRTRRRPRRR